VIGWLLHWLGIDTTTGPFYAFWSGFGSDLGELAIVGALWHHLNCREPHCWRIARHRTPYCARHGRPG
jgi:hypothetical protein